jgi:hypothetical protein
MFRATGADIHSVAGLVHEYGLIDRLAAANAPAPDPARPTWAVSKSRIEHCLHLYVRGNPISLAKRASGYFS